LSSGCESKWKVIALVGDFFTVPISVVLDLQINTGINVLYIISGYQWNAGELINTIKINK